MACGLKYDGIIFANKNELFEYISKGTKPETNTSIQEVKNDIIKDALTSRDINTGIDAIINVAEITDQQRALLNDAFGVDTSQAYVEYVETGNIAAANKNAIQPIFQDISTNIKDIVSSVEYANSQQGSKPIEVSPEIIEFTNKIKINDSQRFIPTIAGSEGGSPAGVLQSQKEKWFNPRSEEGAESTTGEVQAIQEHREGNINRESTGDNGINKQQQRSVRDGQDSTASEVNTARDSGVNIDGNPRRVQLATGEYVSWDSDTREWTNIVRNVSGDRWGTVRPASQRERAAAADERSNRIITTESNSDVAINLIFGQGDPIGNLSALKGMGYINLNPTELYNKIKAQFDNNAIGIDAISSAIGTDMYPVLLSKSTELDTLVHKLRIDTPELRTLLVSEDSNSITIDMIEVDRLERKKGIGSSVIEQIIQYADSVGKEVNLIPGQQDSNFGTTSRSRLVGFYKRFGFLENKGRNKDFGRKSGSMFRPSKTPKDSTALSYNDEGQHLAPNGKPSNLTEEQARMVRTKAFKDWFGDWENDPQNASKVLDLNGEPLVVYHGTNAKFSEFKPTKPNYYQITEGWYFFTDNKYIAKNFGNNVMSVFLNIDDPTYEKTGRFNTWNLYDDDGNYGFITEMTDTGAGFANEYVVENLNQIKSATDNSGAFNPDENSILLSKETNYPSNLDNPRKFFSNLGFAPAQTELLTFIHGLIPEAYNKTNTSIKIAMELIYPEQTGFNIMNMLPYTKEEMYDIMTKYQNENISNNLGDVFIHEYVNNEMSFGMERNKEILDSIINRSKVLQIELPQQYENYFQATNKFKTFFTKGQKLRNKEDILYVHDINYSNPENITYVLWHPQEDAYYEMDMLKMDLFREDTESDFENMEDNAVAVINALEEIGTMVRFMPQQDSPGIFNIFNNEIYLDVRKLSNRLLYHEAAHAVFTKGIRLNKDNVTKLHTEIANVLRNGTPQERALAGRLDFFVQRYTEAEAEAAMMPLDELRAHEFLAELVAQLASNKQNISKQSERSIIDKIIEFFRNIFGYNQNLDINNIDNVIEMINGIANKLRTGETINFSDYESIMSDQNINQGVLYARGDYYKGDVSRVLSTGKKIAVTLPDGKGTMATVGLTGTNNDGDGFTELEFSDGKIERYKTEHLVLRENSLGNWFIYMVPAASQKANPTHQGNVLSDSDKQMLKEFALEQKADGTYEYSINDIHSLIKDDVQVDYNVFVDIINGFREEQALAAAKNADPVSDEVYQDFVDNNSVSQDVLESIADKVARRKKLSKREEAIFVGRTAEINKIIVDYATAKTPTTPVAPSKTKKDKDKLKKILATLNSMTVTAEVAEILRTGVPPGKLINFDSGETIEAKTGSVPENSQLAVVFETKKALETGREVLAKLKEYYGDNAFNKIIKMLDTGRAGMVGTSVMYVAMSQDLSATLEEDPSSAPLIRAMRKKLNRFMQAYARNASIIMNLQRVANIKPETLFASSNIANYIVIKGETKEAKDELLQALYQEELDKAYEKYAEDRENAAMEDKPYTKTATTTSTSKKRKKSDPSDWVPRGGGFLDNAIKTVRDFINKNC